MRITESNIFEELDYAFYTTDLMDEVERATWLIERYGQEKGIAMTLLLFDIRKII